MITEENEVFPVIKEYEKKPIKGLTQRIHKTNGGLENEHEAQGDILKRIREITNDFPHLLVYVVHTA